MTRELVEKIDRGDEITNAELEIAVKFYEFLERATAVLGDRFHLAWAPVHGTLQRLYMMKLQRRRSCNRHNDCDSADRNTKSGLAQHCHDSDCEDCFPK